MEERELIFNAMYWSFEDIEDEEENSIIIHIGGMTKDQKTVQVKVEGFRPYVYLQLPSRIEWTNDKCKKVFDYFKGLMKKNAPLNYKIKRKKLLYFKQECLFLFLTFSTSKACREISYKCGMRNFITGLGMFQSDEFLVHEHNIDPILKFTSMKKIHLASWIKVIETIHEDENNLSEDERKFSIADIDMYVNYKDIEPYEFKETIILHPLYCSFDIECYSVNHNSKLPDPSVPENVVFQISMYFGKFNDSNHHESYLLSLFDPFPIEDSKLKKFKTEKELLLYFSSLIRKKDPLFFIGYNIMKFDWTYMIKRAELNNCLPKFLNISRLIGKKADVSKASWSSSAYGDQEFKYPDCFGRTQLDVLIEVERNYRLPIYSLNAVAERFLGEQKDDITPRQLFMFYKITKEILPLVSTDENISLLELRDIQKKIKSILPFRKTHGIVRKHRRRMLNCEDSNTLRKLIRECLTMTLKYCKQDTILPIKLVNKLNLLTTMEEMSNVMHVPMSYLHTRGQQIKVLAQVFREAMHDNFVIPFNKKNPNKEKEFYEGAIVAEAHAGDYDNVGTLDFCLTGDTLISTDCGYSIPLKDFTKNNKVIGWDGNSFGNYASEGVVYKGKKETVKIWLQDGSTIVSTPDHKFMLEDGMWCRADELVGKYVKCGLDQPRDVVCKKEKNWKLNLESMELHMKTKKDRENALAFARLIGYILSDGSIYITTDKKGRTRKCCEVSMGTMIDAKDIMKDIIRFDREVTIRKRSRGVKGTTYCITIPAYLSKNIHSIENIVVGKRATQPMKLPSFILDEECPLSVVREFLAGLFGGDGTAPYQNKSSSSFGNISFKWTTIEKYKNEMIILFEQIQKLLTKFDISSSRLETKVKYGENSIKPKNIEKDNCRWDIFITISTEATSIFQEKLGFRYCINKNAKLVIANSFYKTREKIRSQNSKILDEVSKLFSSQIKIREALEISRKKIFLNEPPIDDQSLSSVNDIHYRRGENKRHPDRPKKLSLKNLTIKKFLQETNTEDWFSTHDKKKYFVSSDSEVIPSFRKKVIGVFKNGEEDVYDIFNVDKVHNFLSGGVQASNCSLYPTTMIAFNICYTTLVKDKSIPDKDCHILEWSSHIGCSHDPLKRKKKRGDVNVVICGDFKHRFQKVIIKYDEKTKTIIRENEGVMPRLERNLLTSRSEVKKEMFKAEARLKMNRGEVDQDELSFFKKCNFEIIEKGTLTEEEDKILETTIRVLNAKQLAIKVSANSAYGAMGADQGFIPLIQGAASVTAMGRKSITMATNKIRDIWKNCKIIYGDSVTGDTPILVKDENKMIHIINIKDLDLFGKEWKPYPFFKQDGDISRKEKSRNKIKNLEVWCDKGWSPIKRVIRHKVNKKIYRVQTRNSIVDVTEDHSLLRSDKTPIKPKDIFLGDGVLCSFPSYFEEFNFDHIDEDVIGKGFNIARENLEENKYVYIPYYILNGTIDVKKLFLIGYKNYCGGCIKSKYKILSQQLYYLLKSTGHPNLNVFNNGITTCIEILENIDIPTNNITNIEILYDSYDDYVYDIETEEGIFHAGVGEIILKNTDSCMITFEGCTLKESFDNCEKASRVVTHYLRSWILGVDENYQIKTKNGDTFFLNKISSKSKEFSELSYDQKIKVLEYESIPTDLSFETMYERFLLLTKKRYIAYPVNKDGKILGVTKKGVVLTRRDNSQYLRTTYKKVSDGILNRKDEKSVMYELYDEIHKLFTRQVPEDNLIIYLGVKKIIEYAKKKKFLVGDKQHEFYIDKNGNPIDDPVGPLDPRLVYTNIPQVLLALKLLNRGTDIPPNTRLEHIYLENIDATHQGEKAEDFTYYKENKDTEGFKIDYLHYLEKLQAPITELIKVKYPRKNIVLYEKLEDAIERVLNINDIDEYKRVCLARIKTYSKSGGVSLSTPSNFVGWDVLKNISLEQHKSKKLKMIKLDEDRWFNFLNTQIIYNNTIAKIYNYKGIDAKVEYVIESYKKGGINDFSIENKVEKEIIEVCQKYKARSILNKLYLQHKVKKRPMRKPTQTGEKLIKNTKVCFILGPNKGKFGSVSDFKEIENSNSKSKKYTFDILLDESDNVIIKNVPREYITSYYYEDNNVMKDIYSARLLYKDFVEYIKKEFSGVIISD